MHNRSLQRFSGLLIERCAEHFGEVEETRRRVAIATCRGRDEKIAEMSKQRDVSTNLKSAVSGFTLIELVAVLAVAGIVSALALAGLKAMVDAETNRNAAARLVTDLMRARSSAIQKRMFSSIAVSDTLDGVSVTFHSTRTGSTATTSPCVDMLAGTVKVGDVYETKFYPGIHATVTADGVGDACFDHHGRPLSDDASQFVATQIELLNDDSVSMADVDVDTSGRVRSSAFVGGSGLAAAAYHPENTLQAGSAPAPPNVDDARVLPTFEVSPGVTSNAEGGSPAQSGGCGGASELCGVDASCPIDSTVEHHDPPCDVCFHPCCLNPCSSDCLDVEPSACTNCAGGCYGCPYWVQYF